MIELKVDHLSFSIEGTRIVSEVSLDVEKGNFVGLIGPNGCGKTTLLKNVYRVLKPDSGYIYLNEEEIFLMKDKKVAKEMAVMVQENHVEFDMTVMDMVLLGRYVHKTMFMGNSRDDLEKVYKALQEVGMVEYVDRSFLSLSGGEKQRVLIARILAQDTKFIILDEPTNHLDIQYQFQIMDVLKKRNITVFAAIHDLNIAAHYCDKIIIMEKGEIIHYGAPDEVFTVNNIEKLYHIKADIQKNKSTGKLMIYYIPNSEKKEKN